MAKTKQGVRKGLGLESRSSEAVHLGFRGLGTDSASPPTDWQAAPGRPMGRPGWDYLMGGEGKTSLILPGAQINARPGRRGTAQGRACAWSAAPTLTNSGSTLKSVCSTTPKSGAGSNLGRMRCAKVWPPHRDGANSDDREAWALGAQDITHLLSWWA